MFSRTRGPKKPLFVQKTRGSKVRKSKDSVADGDPGSDGSRAMEKRIAKLRILRDWYNDTCGFYFNPEELCTPGAMPVDRKIPTCPHQGNKTPFSFMFCKPDCDHGTPMIAVCSPGADHNDIEDNAGAPGRDEGHKASKSLKMMRIPSAPFLIPENCVGDPPGYVSLY
ncbi:uncharacterized protein LOC126797920 isoform X2 [Argentina anserina]|uniref:uncharacterized protein LOC126797920 isoform X2 n=1 Tax=Argentina anserina TaxID=57926 RepID=UPI002176329A|nr:uncharacterized protein LOC126797920 isoform X2 [Potentilla anserina]